MHATILALSWATLAVAHAGHEQKTIAGPHQSLWYNTLPGDGGTQACASTALRGIVLHRDND